MKLNFTPPKDNKAHNYCINCHAEAVRKTEKDGQIFFVCKACGQTHPRSLYFDNRKYWIDNDNELWHETAAVFVRNAAGKFLFFDRAMFPLGLTIPAGHVDEGEEAEFAASRELEEEVGIGATAPRLALTTDIVGDSCSSGADVHVWHVYVEDYTGDGNIEVKEEGKDPVWLTLEEARPRELPFAIRYLLDNYSEVVQTA